ERCSSAYGYSMGVARRDVPSYFQSTGKVWSSNRKGFLMSCAALLLLGQRHTPVVLVLSQQPGRDSGPTPASRSASAQDHGSPSTTGRGAVPEERWYELRLRARCETAGDSPSGDDILAPRHIPSCPQLMREQSRFGEPTCA